jgi:hypothetical protein
MDSVSRLLNHPRGHVFNGELSLDQNDNWIPDLTNPGAAKPNPILMRVVDYFYSIDEGLASEFRRVSALTEEAAVREIPRYDLKGVEVYWEFACPEPLALYGALTPALKSFRRFVQRRLYPNGSEMATKEEIIHNCPSWSFPLTGGGILRLYAKTNRRLRVEVAFDVADVSGIRVTSISRTGLYQQLELCRVEAAARVNELFEHLADFFPRLATIMPIYCTVAGAGAGGALRRLATVRSRELCEALESRAGLLPAA